MQRISVVLPDPEGPMTTTVSPRATVKSTLCSTVTGPKALVTCCMSTAGRAAAASPTLVTASIPSCLDRSRGGDALDLGRLGATQANTIFDRPLHQRPQTGQP